jgi:outer membrane protein
MKILQKVCAVGLFSALGVIGMSAAEPASSPAPAASTNAPTWLTAPLPLTEAINLALRQNSAILKSKTDIQAAIGVTIQTKAIAIPKVQGASGYTFNDAVEKLSINMPTNFPGSFSGINPGSDSWNGSIKVVQSIYEGGRIASAFRTARLTRDQAVLQYDAVVADTIFEVRQAYYDVLLAQQQIIVQEASLELLERELKDTASRFDAGTVPRFNVLRAEVEVANSRPKLIRARNSLRISKNNLANLLGYNIPRTVWVDIPMTLTDKLQAEPFAIELADAVAQGLKNRPELKVLQKTEGLRRENVVTAKAGNRPSLQVFGGYNARSPQLRDDFFSDVSGWLAGVQLSWNIFDGNATRGRVMEAQARLERAQLDIDDNSRRIELEIRTAYSQFIEAREVLESQKKVQEQADEALRLARSRAEAGTSTQLDVLNAQTSLTEARTTEVQARHDYEVARARLERAIGATSSQATK